MLSSLDHNSSALIGTTLWSIRKAQNDSLWDNIRIEVVGIMSWENQFLIEWFVARGLGQVLMPQHIDPHIL